MAIFRESARTLFALVRIIPEKVRIAIYLHFFEGYSYQEIGQILGEKPENISRQVRYWLKKLVDYVLQAKLTPHDVARRLRPLAVQSENGRELVVILLVSLFYTNPDDFNDTTIFRMSKELLASCLLPMGVLRSDFPPDFAFGRR
jgi:hypothetical protein